MHACMHGQLSLVRYVMDVANIPHILESRDTVYAITCNFIGKVRYIPNRCAIGTRKVTPK